MDDKAKAGSSSTAAKKQADPTAALAKRVKKLEDELTALKQKLAGYIGLPSD